MRFRGSYRAVLLTALLIAGVFAANAQRRALPPGTIEPPLGQAWFWYDPSAHTMRPFVVGYTPPHRALYHRIELRPGQTRQGVITFRARQGLCVFLDARLVFTAPASATYTLNLNRFVTNPGIYLLACWHPFAPPDPTAFLTGELVSATPDAATTVVAQPRPHLAADPNRNVFILLLLAVGLLYGTLRIAFGVSISRFLRLQIATRQGGELRLATGTLPSTPLTVLFVLGFSLSFALLIVIVHTRLENALIFRYLFPISDLDITLRVGLYTVLILAFVLLRYVFLYVVGYVFDLTTLVRVQYAAFIRTLLQTGVWIPVVILLHLVLSDIAPNAALRFSNALLALLLITIVARSGAALRTRDSLINLHLFSYLCATEVIPLIVLLRLIVFPFF